MPHMLVTLAMLLAALTFLAFHVTVECRAYRVRRAASRHPVNFTPPRPPVSMPHRRHEAA